MIKTKLNKVGIVPFFSYFIPDANHAKVSDNQKKNEYDLDL